MRTIYDEFLNADTDISCYVRENREMARIEVLYFPDKDNVIRKILRSSKQKEKIFYDKGEEED